MDQVEHDTAEHDAFLCSYLAERDEECPMCSYNLRGLTGQVCPECGEGLRMRVSLCEPKLGLFLAGVIGWAVGVGFSGLIIVAWVVPEWFEYGMNVNASDTWILWVQVVVQGLVLGLSLWRRRQIRKRSVQTRAVLAAMAWILSVAFAFGFFALMGR